MKIHILGDRVLVRPEEAKEARTKEGLYLAGAEVTQEESIVGEVVSVGLGKKDTILDPKLKVGAKVMFVRYAASEVKSDDEKLMVVRMDDITAVLED